MINQKIIKILSNGLQEKTVKETNDFLLSRDLPWYFSQTSFDDGSDYVDNANSPTFWMSEFNLLENKIISNLWNEIYTLLQFSINELASHVKPKEINIIMCKMAGDAKNL